MLRVPTHTHLTSSAPVPHDTHPHLSLPQLWPPRGPLSCVRPSSPTCYREQVRGPGSSSVPHNFPLKSSNSPTNTLTDSALSSAAGGPRPMALRPPHQALVGPPLPGPPGPPMMLPPMARAPGPPLGSMAALRPPLVSVDRELMARGVTGGEMLNPGLMGHV